jgi:hypothetical protein
MDWEQRAIALFFYNYVLYSTSSGSGYLDFLPRLYDCAPAGSCLMESTKAVSMACLANISSMHNLRIQAQECYGRALKLVRRALSIDDGVKCDQVLTSLVLLQKFEVKILGQIILMSTD